jgi:cell fate regulator YaaT (PSP1 superfamily)
VEARYLISYGAMGEVAVFTTSPGAVYDRGEEVVVATDRGVEAGTVLSRAAEPASETNGENGESPPRDKWRLLRALSPDDVRILNANAGRRRVEFDVWRQRLMRLPIAVELVDLEYLLEDDTVVLHLLADEGADFAPIASTLSKIAGRRLIFQRFGDDPTTRRKGGCSGGSCTCGQKEA